jgi:hypothetical protein
VSAAGRATMSNGMTTEREEGSRAATAEKKRWRLGQRPGGVRQPLGLAHRKDHALITMLEERDGHRIR